MLTVEADGTVSGVVTPPAFRATTARGGQRFTPGVAWKMEEMPDGGGVMMLHQRGVDEPIQTVAGGYGGPDPCNSIVHPAVTMVSSDGTTHSGPAMAGMVLAVDMAISPDGKRVAFVSAGNSTNSSQRPRRRARLARCSCRTRTARPTTTSAACPTARTVRAAHSAS